MKFKILDVGEGDAYCPIKDLLIGLIVRGKDDGRKPYPQDSPLFRSGTFVISLSDYHNIKAAGEKLTGKVLEAFRTCFGVGPSDREAYFLHVQVEEVLTKEQEAYAEIDQLDDLSGGPIKLLDRKSSRPRTGRRLAPGSKERRQRSGSSHEG